MSSDPATYWSRVGLAIKKRGENYLAGDDLDRLVPDHRDLAMMQFRRIGASAQDRIRESSLGSLPR